MKKLGLLVHNLNASQMGMCLVNECNIISKSNFDIELILFYQNYSLLPALLKFPSMQNRQAWGSNYNLLAVDLSSALSLTGLKSNGKLFYYPQEIDWLINPATVTFYRKLYNNPDIEIIANSQYYYNVIQKIWKTPIYIIEDFNHEQIIQFADEKL